MAQTSTLTWHSAQDEIPDDDLAVLCVDNDDVWLGYHEDGRWWSVDAREWPTVRLWVDLPDPSTLDLARGMVAAAGPDQLQGQAEETKPR